MAVSQGPVALFVLSAHDTAGAESHVNTAIR